MEGQNFISREQHYYNPQARGEPFARGFWLTTVIALLMGIFSLSVIVFSATSRRSHAPTPIAAKDTVSKVWVKKPLTKCAEDWHKRKIDMETYLKSQGIKIFQKEVLVDPAVTEEERCETCFCASGEILYLNIDEENLEDLKDFIRTEPPK